MKSSFERNLTILRQKIDSVDRQLIQALAVRMAISKKMGQLKKNFGVPILQQKRWKEVISLRLKHAGRVGLDLKVIDRIFKEIHRGSIAVQKKVKRKK